MLLTESSNRTYKYTLYTIRRISKADPGIYGIKIYGSKIKTKEIIRSKFISKLHNFPQVKHMHETFAYLSAFLALCLAMRRPTPNTFLSLFFFSLICFLEPSLFLAKPTWHKQLHNYRPSMDRLTLANLYLGSIFLASSIES